MVARRIAPLVVIVGETASGKSDLGMYIAEKFNGEIIAADSRTVYKGMDIGTAKPSVADQEKVRHHLLDVVSPDERYTAAQFKEDANKCIEEIRARGHLPVMVGGTGLYIDSVIFDYDFAPEDQAKRSDLDMLSLEELQLQAGVLGIEVTDVDFKNRRHLQRAVERGRAGKTNTTLRDNTLVIGTRRDRIELDKRIEDRIEAMIEAGFVDEVDRLLKRYGSGSEAMTGIGYKAFASYLKGEISLEDAKQQFIRNDKRLAKRQRTWFKRNKSIHYPLKQSEVVELVTTLLSKN